MGGARDQMSSDNMEEKEGRGLVCCQGLDPKYHHQRANWVPCNLCKATCLYNAPGLHTVDITFPKLDRKVTPTNLHLIWA